MNDRGPEEARGHSAGLRPRADNEVVRTALGIVFLFLLLGTAFWILRPLLPAIVWSAAIVVATWPLLIGLEKRLPGGRTLAAAVLTILLTLLLLLPIFLGVMGILDNAERITEGVHSLSTTRLPEPPKFLERLPFLGERVAQTWRQIAAEGGQGVLVRLTPYADRVTQWLLSQLGSAGKAVFHIVMTLIGVVFLYRHGETIGARVRRFASRLAGDHGVNAVYLAAQATRSVALGVLVTAIVQALLAGLGLAVAGVPSAGLLTVLMIVTGLAQLGPMPVLLPGVAWLYWQGEVGWGTGLLVWSGLVGTIDNVLRPFLMSRGANLPLMLVFVGVIGGLFAFGVVGLFIGPVVLAVAYRLSEDWMTRQPPGGEVTGPPAPPADG
jgi:predicted PurR-regulated permease PerM